jgi:hypothetical protein
MLLALFAAAAASAAEPPLPVTLHYTLRAAGLTSFDLRVAFSLAPLSYAVTVQGETRGAADWLVGFRLNVTSVGSVTDGRAMPALFGTDNRFEGETRRTRVSWADGNASADEIVPSPQDEGRETVPPELQAGSVDPVGAVVRFGLGPVKDGRCEGAENIFDGRRSYTLTLDGGTRETVDIGGTPVEALKCRLVMTRTGGRSDDSWPFRSADVEESAIWFWTLPQGYAIPVRVEADAPIGTAVGELVSLPQVPTALR